MLEQSEQLNVKVQQISAIELGERKPPPNYAERFADWLGLASTERTELVRMSAERENVLRFRPRDAQEARKLFRKINTLTPREIRRLKVCLLERLKRVRWLGAMRSRCLAHGCRT
jgi:hypothetical protein